MEDHRTPHSDSKLCVFESSNTVVSNVTPRHVAIPIENKYHHVTNRLHVQDVPVGTRCRELALFFSKFGVVIDCNIVDPVKPFQKYTYGFVTYDPNIGTNVVPRLVVQFQAGRQDLFFQGFKLKINFARFKPKKSFDERPFSPHQMGRRTSIEDDSEPFFEPNMGRRGSQVSLGGESVFADNMNAMPLSIVPPHEIPVQNPVFQVPNSFNPLTHGIPYPNERGQFVPINFVQPYWPAYLNQPPTNF